jgi:hypothetical protein
MLAAITLMAWQRSGERPLPKAEATRTGGLNESTKSISVSSARITRGHLNPHHEIRERGAPEFHLWRSGNTAPQKYRSKKTQHCSWNTLLAKWLTLRYSGWENSEYLNPCFGDSVRLQCGRVRESSCVISRNTLDVMDAPPTKDQSQSADVRRA